jgi:hypothetical protein
MRIHDLCIVSLVVVHLDLSLNSFSMFKFKSICPFSFFFPSLFSFGPSPAGPFSPLPFFSFSPLQPGPRPLPSPSFSFPARAAHSPVQLSSSRSRPPFLPSLSSFPRARTACFLGPSARSSDPAPSLCLTGPTGRASPSPRRPGLRVASGSSPRDHRRLLRLRLGPARPGTCGCPYLSAASTPCP